jgi:hypothetical protein
MKSLFSGALQYIVNGDGAEELYDVVEDYDQTANLVDDPSLALDLARFRAALDSITEQPEPGLFSTRRRSRVARTASSTRGPSPFGFSGVFGWPGWHIPALGRSR